MTAVRQMNHHPADGPGGHAGRRRELWVDTLRVAVIAGVIVMHTATGYVVDVGWYYEERTTSEAWQIALTVPAFLGGLFALGPLFFVSGWLSAPSLARRGPGGFARGRLLRLGVPLVVFTLLIDPLADFWGDHAEGGSRPFGDYLLDRTHSRDTGPLWFVAALLVCSLLYAGWRHRHRDHGAAAAPTGWHLSAAMALVAVGSFVVWQWSSLTDDTWLDLNWGQWPQGAVLFALGVWAGERGWLDGWLPPRARRLAGVALAALVVLLALAGYGLARDDVGIIAGSLNLPTLLFTLCDGVVAVAGSLWLIAALRAHRPSDAPWRAAAARSSYATYVIHPLVVVALMAPLRGWSVAPETKLLAVAPIAVVAAYAAGYLLTRIPGVRRVV